MSPKLTLVATPGQIRNSLLTFNGSILGYSDLAWDVVRRTTYWIYDERSCLFGPAKYVGFADMDTPTYQRARDSGSSGDPFDGHATRRAIEACLGEFGPDASLTTRLVAWAQGILGPQVLNGVRGSKWKFVRIATTDDDDVDWSSWSKWAPLKGKVLKGANPGPGCYVIRVVEAPGGRARAIRRCVGTDIEGILDIGESGGLRYRLQTLLRCMKDSTKAGHMAGWRYAYLGMDAHFPLDRLEVRWVACASKADAYRLEGVLLGQYVEKHFELPPLNYKFNWSKD